MAHPYIPVGDEPSTPAGGSALALIPQDASPSTYTQTYATPARDVPAATVAAVTATVAAEAPAGGTGADEGCWDTAGHRNTAITTINEIKALLESIKTQQAALAADVLALKKVETALVDDLQGWGIVS